MTLRFIVPTQADFNRRNDTGNVLKDMHHQATISMTVPVSKNTVQGRMAAYSINGNPVKRITQLVDPNQLNVEPGDLVFCLKEELSVNRKAMKPNGLYRSVPKSHLLNAYVSTAGMVDNYGAQYPFERSQRFIGVAATAVLVAGQHPGNVFTTFVGGATSIMAGFTPFFPGDIVRWKLPPLKQDGINDLVKQMHAQGRTVDYSRAQVDREEPAHILELPLAAADELAKLKDAEFLQKIREALENVEKDGESDTDDFIRKELIFGSCVDAAMAVSALAKTGLISVLDIERLDQTKLGELPDGSIYKVAGGGAIIIDADKGQDIDLLKLINWLKREGAPIVKRLVSARTTSLTSVKMGPPELDKILSQRAALSMESFYTAYRSMAEKRVGTAMNACSPGGKLDVKLG